MNTQQIAHAVTEAGGKVLQKKEDSVLAENKKGVRFTFVPNDRSLSKDSIAKKLGVKSKKKTTKTAPADNSAFEAELEAIKGVGPASAEALAAGYTKDQLLASLKDGSELPVSNTVVSALKKEYL